MELQDALDVCYDRHRQAVNRGHAVTILPLDVLQTVLGSHGRLATRVEELELELSSIARALQNLPAPYAGLEQYVEGLEQQLFEF